jgi:hypothetical protein
MRSKQDGKKSRKWRDEKLIMQQFRGLYPDFPGGKLVKSESPDFLLKTGTKRTIGIEITRLAIPDEYPALKDPVCHEQIAVLSPHKLYDMVESTIEKKETKRPLYQKSRPDQLWLIIVISGKILEIPQNLDNLVEKWQFSSKFERIFLMAGQAKIFQLV